jgi:metal-dependent amidase/aminoacylase/carboxypeptidase family protein
LTIGHFEALGATNVIPSIAKLKGTFRTFNEEWREKAHQWITEYINSTCEMAGAKAELRIEKGYPFLNNDEQLVTDFIGKLTKNAPNITLIPLDIRMTSEDFSYYSQQIPACFFRLGTSNSDKQTKISVHNPQFKVDEEALSYGIKAFSSLALALD